MKELTLNAIQHLEHKVENHLSFEDKTPIISQAYLGYLYKGTCVISHDASVVHASGSGQLQANPHPHPPWLSPGKPTRRAVTTMESNDLVVGEDHMLGLSCQRYNWQTGRCGSIALAAHL